MPRRLVFASLLFALAIIAWRLTMPLRVYATAITVRNRALTRCLDYQPVDATNPVFDESLHLPPVSFRSPFGASPIYRIGRQNPPTTQHTTHPASPGFSIDPQCLVNLRHAEDALYKNRVHCESGMRQSIDVYQSPGTREFRSRNPILILLHRLKSPAGHERLVEVYFDAPAFIWGTQSPFRAVVTPPTSLSRLSMHEVSIPCSFTPDVNKRVRLFPASTNPTDPARFQVPYTVGNTAQILEGRLNDDDTITLAPQTPSPD
jgi:hypothetical protein